MDDTRNGSIVLGLGRIAISFTFIWAFFDKLLGLGFPSPKEVAIVNGGSPTEYYLSELTSGFLEGMWESLAGNAVVDAMLMIGLLLVGVAMLVGVASRLSTVGYSAMMILMYLLVVPPADNPLVDYHIIYIFLALAIYYYGGYRTFGLEDRWMEIEFVKKHPILW